MSAAPRIALLGFWHETNTFAATRTGRAEFRAYQHAAGDDMIARYRGTGTELGGMIAGAERRGLTLVPLVFAAAVPSGLVTDAFLEEFLDETCRRLEVSGPVDGVLVVLHGAAVGESYPDADGAVLQAVRRIVGRTCPVAATIDLHANVSETMAESADVLVGYDTYPHTDMAARGAEAVDTLCRLLEGEALHRTHVKVPLLTAPQSQATDEEPTRGIMAALAEVESRRGIVTASIAMGFAYADCADLGASVLVHGDDAEAVAAAAEDLAAAIWARRAAFRPVLLPPERIAAAIGEGAAIPVVLLDPADNVGGGSAGDGTVILAELLRCDAERAVIVMFDPEAAAVAAAVGVGARFEGLVGGKTDAEHGPPAMVAGEVEFAGEATFRHSGSYMTGFVTHMGLTAVVRAGGVRVVLTSLRTMPFDIEQLRCVGVEPAEQRVIVAKSAIAWRSAFGAVAGSVFTIDAPGIATSNLERVPYRFRPRPLYPLEPETTFCEGGPT